MIHAQKTLAPSRTSKSLSVSKASIVRNPIIGATNRVHQPKGNTTHVKPVPFHMHSQYLTVSSEETSTYTELEGDELVDVDYVSEHSLDLSNEDEDEEENFEDIQTEIYLRDLFYSIDRLTFDDLNATNANTPVTLIDLPKNLVAECHVWRQKFRTKKLNPNRTPGVETKLEQQTTAEATTTRPRRTSTEEIISKVIDWSVENSMMGPGALPKLSSMKLEKPLAKVVKPNGGWMQSQQTLLAAPSPQPPTLSHVHPLANRITALPPIINPKRPLSNDIHPRDTSHLSNHNNAVIYTKTKSELRGNEESSRPSQQKHQMQTSQSFNEQQFEGSGGSSSHNKAALVRSSASSSYSSRITLDDLMERTTNSQINGWTNRSPGYLISSHIPTVPGMDVTD